MALPSFNINSQTNEKQIPADEFINMIIERCSSAFNKNSDLVKEVENLLEQIGKAYPKAKTQAWNQSNDEKLEIDPFKPGLRNRKHPHQFANNTTVEVPASFFSNSKPANKASVKEEPSFLKIFAQNYFGALLGPAGLILALSSVGVASAQSTFESGFPKDGISLCAGLEWCIEGFVKNATNGATLSQISRQIKTEGNVIPAMVLDECFGPDKLEGTMTSVLKAVADWVGSSDCSSSTQKWNNAVMSAQATNLNEQSCKKLQSVFETAVASCETGANGGKVFGIGLGFTAAAFVAVGVIILAGVGVALACAQKEEIRQRCCTV